MLSSLLRWGSPERAFARTGSPALVAVTRAVRRPDLGAVATLMRGFRQTVRRQYAVRPWVAERYFDELSWRRELATLPGDYAPPRGVLLLARVDGMPAGCVGLRPLPGDDTVAEVKRLYVDREQRVRGLGRALLVRLLHEAQELGYRRVVLETGVLQLEAQRLYTAVGFRRIAPYHRIPSDLAGEIRCFGMDMDDRFSSNPQEFQR